jgi:hypothetical protein
VAFTEFKKTMLRVARQLNLRPGDLYEDCCWHPVLCLGVNYKTDELWGISLIDGTSPRSCSLVHCGVRKLTPKEAWLIKCRGPSDPEVRGKFSKEARWWNVNTEREAFEPISRVGPVRLKPKSATPSAKKPKPAKQRGGDA